MAVTMTVLDALTNKTSASVCPMNVGTTIPANSEVVVALCVDSASATGPTVSSITNIGGGTWTNRAGSVSQSGATSTAGAGVFVYCYTLFTTSSVAASTAVTVTLSAATVVRSWTFAYFTEVSDTLR